MTPEEAIKKLRLIAADFEDGHIETCGAPYEYGSEDAEPLRMAADALEKQIPKKLEIHTETIEDDDQVYDIITCFTCPVCGGVVAWYHKYCDECGQAMDWSEVGKKR